MSTTTKGSTKEVSPSEAAKLYATHLKQKSWCVDYSINPPRALHADSNYNVALDLLCDGFPSWASAHGIRVATDCYASFLENLGRRLRRLLPHVAGSSFKPVPKRFFDQKGVTLANTFVPFEPEVPTPFVMPEILDEYLSRVFMNDQDKKIVVQWLADIIQNPARRPQWAVVLTGDQGTGKSSIFRMVKMALGDRHAWEKNSYADVFRQFSEVLPDNLLVCFDDAKGNRNTYQDLKQVITRTSQQCELKGVTKLVPREVYARVLICSNSPRPLVIEPSDRRLYVAEPSRHKVSPEETAQFFVRFNTWLEQDGAAVTLYAWLKSVDLSDFNPASTIKTETHRSMVDMSTSDLDTLVQEFVKDSPVEVFHAKTLSAYLAEHGHNPKPDLLRDAMRDSVGYVRKRRWIEGHGSYQETVWQPIEPEGQPSRPLTDEEIAQIQGASGRTF